MSMHPASPQKPRHIAPSIHVLATRLAQNTADRVTIGNTPLHILHLSDAQYLAPLLASCHSLRAVTVHLTYVASSTALETFLKAAARCPTLQDVRVVGGATVMEATAIAAGLAAFSETTPTLATPAVADIARHMSGRTPAFQQLFHSRPLSSRRVCGGRGGRRLPPSLPTSNVVSPLMSELRQPVRLVGGSFRQPLTQRRVPPLSSGRPTFANPSVANGRGGTVSGRTARCGGQRDGAGSTNLTPVTPALHQNYQMQALPPSPDARRTLSRGVRVVLELHRVSEETVALLLDGVRKGSRISSIAVQLRVGTTEARLTGLRFAQKAQAATAQHRHQMPPSQHDLQLQQQQQRPTPPATTRVPHPPTETRSVGAPHSGLHKEKLHHRQFGGHSDCSGRQGLTTSPRVPAFPTRWMGQPRGPAQNSAYEARPTASMRQACTPPQSHTSLVDAGPLHGAYWMSKRDERARLPRTPTSSSHGGPHTPPAARAVRDAGNRQLDPAVGQTSLSSDSYRRQGLHFFSSERSTAAIAGGQLFLHPQRPQLRGQLLRALLRPTQQQRTPVLPTRPSPADETAEVVHRVPHPPSPPRRDHVRSNVDIADSRGSVRNRHRRRPARSSTRTTSSAASSLFSPIVLDPAGFRRGRSSSFSSWSSRSTSPQPRPPPSPVSQRQPFPCAARAYVSLMRRHGACAGQGQQQQQPEPSEHSSRYKPKHDDGQTFVDAYKPLKCARCATPLACSASPCSPRYCHRRSSDDFRASAAVANAAPRRDAVAHGPQPRSHSSYGDRKTPLSSSSACSCFVCALRPPSPRTPSMPRCSVCRDDAGAGRPTAPEQVAAPECREADGYASNTSSPGITARTPSAHKQQQHHQQQHAQATFHRRVDEAVSVIHCPVASEARVNSPHQHSASQRSAQRDLQTSERSDGSGAAVVSTPVAATQQSRRCVSRTQLPSHDSLASFSQEGTTPSDTAETSEESGQRSGSTDSEGYVVYPNSLKFLRARVAEINRHVVWHQVKAAKEAEEHAKRLAALEVAFAGRMTEQLSDILMVLTDMEHGSRRGR